jgi:Mg2+-importing ATPase
MTSFDRGVNGVSWLLLRFMLVMAPIVFLINGLFKHNWGEAFFFALSVAVGLTPEMLPMIVTANLARGAIIMSEKKSDCQKSRCHPKLRGDGHPLYGQDGDAHPG